MNAHEEPGAPFPADRPTGGEPFGGQPGERPDPYGPPPSPPHPHHVHQAYQTYQPYQGPVPPYPGYPPHVGFAPAPRRRRGRSLLVTVAVAAVALATGIGISRAYWQPQASPLPAATGSGSTGYSNGSGGSGSSGSGSGGVTDVSSAVDPSLVVINTVLGYQGGRAAGTGIVLSSNGEIITNNHVIDGATAITATDLGNGRTYTASVVGYDSGADLAVLKLTGASGLTTARTADSSKVRIGDQVTAIGNAGGTGRATPASGTVTALDQSITASDPGAGTSEQLSGMIQVNADVQSGDSGGSLVDAGGAVIGIDTAGSDSGSGAGSGGIGSQGAQGSPGAQASQGYAIPINTALSVAKQIMAGQSGQGIHLGQTAFLGVQVATGSGAGGGAALAGVVSGSPAARSGLTAGDVITAVDGRPVTDPASLTAVMGTSTVGHPLSVQWTDTAGTSHTTTITPVSGPAG
ncbi:S1C family serine protease [Kitasatospora sp. NPDC006697]|uniref:S1C family serine protease n=1 Tax=Kitasatospora sp. NPDC006697 TaxID=3364020 RepID=UPI00369AF1BB